MSSKTEEFKDLPTTCISDALSGLTNMDQSIKPVKENLTLCGRAYTVKVRAADNKVVLKAIKEANQGDILVIDAKGFLQNASCGDFIVGLAQTLGLGGIVIDGAIRDLAGIQDMDFPVFCKGTTIAASDKHGTGETNVPISCGNAVIRPGDIIKGDIDGVVVIPQELEEEVLKKAIDKLQKDNLREQKVIGNPEAAKSYIDEQLA
ncbi:RraA family protein [Planococcus sp. ISL-109]|uniref:RraA family protein n=1 Tax=Planococcus sp. ISL-109 TaxID=2819166 RepID=UPI001BE89832|nr:RraA family protein [Planococcus sp. ISL-109]MBT2584037.1 RraA family protein [Planococcus sp. ISL-109]